MALLGALALVGAARARAEDAPAPATPLPEITIDHDDIDVTSSVRVKPGTYRVKDANGDGVLRVHGDWVFIDLAGVTLVGSAEGQTPDTFDGAGIRAVGSRAFGVRGGEIRGYRVGIAAERSKNLWLEDVDGSGSRRMRLRSTPQREDESDWLWPHENDDGQWAKNYGAAISLLDCPNATVTKCRAHDGQNGLLLSRCDGATVTENDFSLNSGWGIALWRTCDSTFSRNRCDLCVRGYSDGVYARGQDSAGFLVFEQCSRNTFRDNSATHSGDGLFLYAGNETLKKSGKGGCNDNVVERNDFSYAVANGIEATFSRGNAFRWNRCNGCDHGVWAGYSYSTTILGNEIADCANGISIEHGVGNRLTANTIERCGIGIHLWAHSNKDLDEGPFGKARDVSSSFNDVMGNTIEGGRVALLLDEDRDSQCVANSIRAPSDVAIELKGEVGRLNVHDNSIDAARAIRAATKEDVDIDGNAWKPMPPVITGSARLRESAETMPLSPPRTIEVGEPAAAGPRVPPGRWFMLVGEWGPIDPRVAVLFPETQSATGAASVVALLAGAAYELHPETGWTIVGAPFRVVSLTDGFDVEPREGRAPQRLIVRPKPGGPTIVPFEIKVRVGDREAIARGTIFSTRWTTRFWRWEKDPRTDRAAFEALVKTPPLVTRETDALDIATSGSPAEGVPADHFATVAETSLDLPAGTWRLRVLSDDGVRVLVDGKPVFEDWTWHGPKEDSVDLTLAAGKHAVRVEHFELDGYTALRCAVEPVAPK